MASPDGSLEQRTALLRFAPSHNPFRLPQAPSHVYHVARRERPCRPSNFANRILLTFVRCGGRGENVTVHTYKISQMVRKYAYLIYTPFPAPSDRQPLGISITLLPPSLIKLKSTTSQLDMMMLSSNSATCMLGCGTSDLAGVLLHIPQL